MCEPVETAQSLGDDTHVVVARPKWAREHGSHTECGHVVSMGLRAWPIDDVLRTRTRAEVNVRSQAPVYKTDKQTENRSKDEDRTTHDRKCRWAKRRKMTCATSSVTRMMPTRLQRPPTRQRWTRSGTSHQPSRNLQLLLLVRPLLERRLSFRRRALEQ